MKKHLVMPLVSSVLLLGFVGCDPLPVPSPTLIPPTATAVPTPTRQPPPPISPQEMARVLATAQVPAYDPVDRLIELGVLESASPRSLSGPPQEYALGDVESFSYTDEIEAELRYITDHAYMWVEAGLEVDQETLVRAADRFEADIYPTVRYFFGEEWSPGVDNDPRISILHVISEREVTGEFYAGDEYMVEVVPASNQREILYVNLARTALDEDLYLATLVHELQHMIQWFNEGNEHNAIDEGMSQLGERLLGFDTVTTHHAFLRQTWIPLDDWPQMADDSLPYYGASYLFALYVWEQLGDDAIRHWARHPGEGLSGLDAALAEIGVDRTADDLFEEWIVANYVDDPALADGRFGYRTEHLGPACPRHRMTAFPMQVTRAISQYAAEYILLEGQGTFTIDFAGQTEVPLVPAAAHSGHSFWWSNRGDGAATSLIRRFDLSATETATLWFWMWYDIEQSADEFACVEISDDGGETWEILEGKLATGAHSPCYSGMSGGADAPRWVREEMDLTPFAGKEIVLRFQYVTDAYFNRPGFAVDDIAIPELGYEYDAESGADGWEGSGFVRTSNAVPQTWALQLITWQDTPTVQRVPVNADGTAHVEVRQATAEPAAVLVVGAMAPASKMAARYELAIQAELSSGPPLRPSQDGLLLYDDFGDACSGWRAHEDAQVMGGYADGAYVIEVKVPNMYWWSTAGEGVVSSGRHQADVMIDVDTVQETSAVDNSWGVLCRFQDEGNYYSFDIGNDGFYAISAMLDGGFYLLRNWSFSTAINRGEGAANHMTVVCDGDRLALSVNDQLVAEVYDSYLSDGDIGLSAGTFARGGARVRFDNVIVRTP